MNELPNWICEKSPVGLHTLERRGIKIQQIDPNSSALKYITVSERFVYRCVLCGKEFEP
jgi:hypothetical protein